jgi:hypothetical protein
MSALAQLVAAYENPAVPDTGVVGYLGNDAPRELIAAAGLNPLRLTGSVPVNVPVTERADAILGPGVDAPVRAVLGGLLAGRPRLDYLLLSHDSDSTVRLFTALRVLARTEPLPELWFLDLLHLPSETTARYNRDRIAELVVVLERWSGREVTGDDIDAATRAAEETTRLLDRLAELRRGGGIAGSEALAADRGAANLPAAEANRLLEELLVERRDAPTASGRRLFLTGSEPSPRLFRALEARGLHIAGESFDRHEAAAVVAREAETAAADVVLAWIRSGDDARAWGIPALRDALDAPVVVLDRRSDEALTAADLALLA